ncbi:MAG: DUF1460 domain-containing protein [Ignavibacteriae bacterium]|nr:MAG: DUF1460 domain-containing protein [Ignavibacteriota bacterium]
MSGNQSRRDFLKTSTLSAISLIALSKGIKLDSVLKFFDDNEKLIKEKFSYLVNAGIKDESIGNIIGEVGKSFIGTDYVAGTLEVNNSEQLVVNLTGLDCVTFVENCLAFSRCLKKGKTTIDDYKAELINIRYRDGVIDGYGSRLHYFCDWIYNNQEKGIVKDITAEIGGNTYEKVIDFMSTHTKSYKQLSDKSELDKVIIAENAINSRDMYHIPKSKIAKAYDLMQTGDIIATTTSIIGLDVTHTGYVYKGDDGGTYFMHASSKMKQVIISKNQLADYIAEDSKKTGIMVARPVDV